MPSIISVIKSVLKKILPPRLKAWIVRMRGENLKSIDLSVINKIRDLSKKTLENAEFLEKELLPELGFNNEQLHQFPPELYEYCGKGVLHWQYPNQFSRYLVLLSQLKPNSYLEIGVRHGGTFIITLEYLKEFTPIKKAIAIDLAYPPGLSKYKTLNPAVHFYQMNSQLPEFKKLVEAEKQIDLVFIDGNHEEWACMNDFMNLKEVANIIAVHDIVSDECPGVKKLWAFIKSEFKSNYFFYEFNDQYASVIQNNGPSFFGIGVAVKKDFHQK